MDVKHVRIYINEEELKLPVLDDNGNETKEVDVLKKETRLIEVVSDDGINNEVIVLGDLNTGQTYVFDRETVLDVFSVLQIRTSVYDEKEYLK